MNDINKNELIKVLESKGIKHKRVLDAIALVPREKFIPPEISYRAYEDNALPIDCEQTISQPYTVAVMTQSLNLNPGDIVLEIGTGSGYQSAILCAMGCRVFSVERIEMLYIKAKHLLNELGYSVNLKYHDGTLGWKEFSPFDAIVVTAAGPSIPTTLLKQLKTGGRLIMPIGEKYSQEMTLVTKMPDDEFEYKGIGQFRFVPLIGKYGWSK